MGGVGMLSPNFCQTASEGVEKSAFSISPSSKTSPDRAAMAAKRASVEKSISDAVDEACEAKAEGEEAEVEEAEEEDDELEFINRSSGRASSA